MTALVAQLLAGWCLREAAISYELFRALAEERDSILAFRCELALWRHARDMQELGYQIAEAA